MPGILNRISIRRRHVGVGCVVLLAGAMWRVAAGQLTGGLLDLAVFVPPGAALGLTAVWIAHAFVPDRFTWQRGLLGALVGGGVASPLIAFLVAFSAAWDRVSFPLVFNLGAWLALAGGLLAGMVAWVIRRIMNWRRSRMRHSRKGVSTNGLGMPDARDGFHPTLPKSESRYPVSSRHPR